MIKSWLFYHLDWLIWWIKFIDFVIKSTPIKFKIKNCNFTYTTDFQTFSTISLSKCLKRKWIGKIWKLNKYGFLKSIIVLYSITVDFNWIQLVFYFNPFSIHMPCIKIDLMILNLICILNYWSEKSFKWKCKFPVL